MWIPSLSQHLLMTSILKDEPVAGSTWPFRRARPGRGARPGAADRPTLAQRGDVRLTGTARLPSSV